MSLLREPDLIDIQHARVGDYFTLYRNSTVKLVRVSSGKYGVYTLTFRPLGDKSSAGSIVESSFSFQAPVDLPRVLSAQEAFNINSL